MHQERIHVAKIIPKYMNIDKNTSPSFQYFIRGVKNLVESQI